MLERVRPAEMSVVEVFPMTDDAVEFPSIPQRRQFGMMPLREALLHHVPESPFSLDVDLFMKNLKCARRGAAAGPSGMTSEHLRSVLENPRDAGLLFQVHASFRRCWPLSGLGV